MNTRYDIYKNEAGQRMVMVSQQTPVQNFWTGKMEDRLIPVPVWKAVISVGGVQGYKISDDWLLKGGCEAMKRIFLIFITVVCMVSCSQRNESDDNKEIARAVGYINNRQYDAAIIILKKIEVKQPNNAFIQYMLGSTELLRDVYDEHGEVKNASKATDGMSHLAKAVEAVPINGKYGLSYSVALAEVGQCTKALPIFARYYEDLKREKLASSKIIYVRYAQCLVESGDTTEARSVLSDLEQSGSVDAEVLKKADAVRKKISEKKNKKMEPI